MKTLNRACIIILLAFIAGKSFAQCTVAFNTTNLNGAVGFFPTTDVVSATWSFGDGGTSTAVLPQHAYPAQGTYQVCLTAIDSAGCTANACQTITVGPCQTSANMVTASFTYATNHYNVSFTSTSSSANPPLSCVWNFPLGNPGSATGTSTSAQFALGNTTAQLTVTDNLGCTATADSLFYVSGNAPCSGQFYYDRIGLGIDSFYDSVTLSDYTYLWQFGDGGTSTLPGPVHTYATNGYYNVCSIVSSQANNCSDTFCSQVFVQACNTYASFVDTIGGSNGELVKFYSTSTTQAPPLTYQWGSIWVQIPNQQNPVYDYSNSGQGYDDIELTVTDANGCSATAYRQITFGPQVNPMGNIYGTVTGGSCPYVVYLIKEDTVGHLVLIDSVTPQDSNGICGHNYQFIEPMPGIYYVKAALQPGSADYANFLPTYFTNAISWANANLVYECGPVGNIDIALTPGTNPGGPGFISGWVSEGAGLEVKPQGQPDIKSLGDAVANVQINLTTAAGQAVAYTYTDARGHYRFNNLAYGDYLVFTDLLNSKPSPIPVTLSAQQPGDTTANDSVNHSAIAAVNNISYTRSIKVYPDPAVSNLNFDITATTEVHATLTLTDLIGNMQLQQPINVANGNNHFELNVANLAEGIYQLTYTSNNDRVTTKVVVARSK